MPNLFEWCHLVDKSEERKKFRDGLDKEDILHEMAQLSFRFLGNFKYHIITCDKKGSILIVPDPSSKNNYSVFRAPAVFRGTPKVSSPLGTGDILTSIFASNFDNSLSETKQVAHVEMVLNAFQTAHETAGAYCSMPWHQMPTFDAIKTYSTNNTDWRNKPIVSLSGVLRVIPNKQEIHLRKHKTVFPMIYTRYIKLRDELLRLTNDLKENIGNHYIIGAPSGFGKSIIIEGINQFVPSELVEEIKGEKFLELAQRSDFTNIEKLFVEKSPTIPPSNPYRIVIVDEAYHKETFEQASDGKFLLNCMDTASERRIKFIFIDSQFYQREVRPGKLISDIESRCMEYSFDGIGDRPMDIALLIASAAINAPSMKKYSSVRISGQALFASASQIMEEKTPRRALENLKKACENASKRRESMIIIEDYPNNEFKRKPPPKDLVLDFFVILK